MQANGVEYLHMSNVDNLIQRIGDPVLLGFAEENGFDITTKYLKKVASHLL